MTAACKNTEIAVVVCSDIFTAIEKGKTQAFSCLIVDWADQPEASFLLKRARESTPNQNTVAIAIVDHDPTPAELRDNRLDFLVFRPISGQEAEALLTKASEKMQPLSARDIAQASQEDDRREEANPSAGGAPEQSHAAPAGFAETNAVNNDDNGDGNNVTGETETAVYQEPRQRHAIGPREVCAAALVFAAAFCLWRSRDPLMYLARTPEGSSLVLQESVAALFYKNQTGALPVGAASNDAQQDAYFSRNPASSNAPTTALRVAATESTLIEARMPLPRAFDFPLPVPTVEHREAPPIHVEHAAVPESMRNSPPIAPPVIVAVNPAQMMPVSAPQPQPATQQFSEPVTVSEEAARALLLHTVNPVYPAEALAQKLHGPVVLQARVGRDGNVEELKIVRGNFLLSRAAIAAVKQWHFQPYTLNGHAAATQTLITINFTYPPG